MANFDLYTTFSGSVGLAGLASFLFARSVVSQDGLSDSTCLCCADSILIYSFVEEVLGQKESSLLSIKMRSLAKTGWLHF